MVLVTIPNKDAMHADHPGDIAGNKLERIPAFMVPASTLNAI
jgi:hypothetical protein